MTALSRRIAATACGLVLTLLAGAPALAQEAPAAAPATEDARLAAFFEETFQRGLMDSPIFQSQLGMKGRVLRQVGRLLGRRGAAAERPDPRRPRAPAVGVQVRAAVPANAGELPDLRGAAGVGNPEFPVALPRLLVPDAVQPGDFPGDLPAERPPHRQRRGCRGLHRAAERPGARLRAVHRGHERVRAARHRAHFVLLRPGDRRRAQRDQRRAVRRQRHRCGDPRRLPRQGGEARRAGSGEEAAARCWHRGDAGPDEAGHHLPDSGHRGAAPEVARPAGRVVASGRQGLLRRPRRLLDDGARAHRRAGPPDRTRRGRAHPRRDAGDHGQDRLPGRPAGVLRVPAHQPGELLPEHGRRAAGLSRPVEGLHRLDLLPTSASTSTCCRRRRSRCGASRNGARTRRRSRSTTSRRRTAAGRASTT